VVRDVGQAADTQQEGRRGQRVGPYAPSHDLGCGLGQERFNTAVEQGVKHGADGIGSWTGTVKPQNHDAMYDVFIGKQIFFQLPLEP